MSKFFVFNNTGKIEQNEHWTKYDDNQSSKLDKSRGTISNSKG